MKVKINTIDLFSGREDVRKFLNIDMRDEDKEWVEDEYGLTEHEIEVVLKNARMFVQMDKLPETIELGILQEEEEK